MPVPTTILSTGEELVLGRIADTNAAFMASELWGRGFGVRRIVAVGDNPAALRAEIERAVADSALVLISGGLGPTADDRNRWAIADALGRELVEHADARAHIEQRLGGFGIQPSPAQLTQALFPAGSTTFPNPRGTACGFGARVGHCWVVAMPGVPAEMKGMFADSVMPFVVEKLAPAGRIVTETVHLYPVPESVVDERIRDMTSADRNPTVGITVSNGTVTVGIRARAADERSARELVARDVAVVKERFGDLVYGTSGATLAGALSAALARAGTTIALAESVTGGLVADMLVDVPGISRFLLAGIVAYSNEAKEALLGVPGELLRARGAVSGPVAEAMAVGAARVAGAALGLSTTGVAGPSGGSREKPVGLVYVGVCLDGQTAVHELQLHGSRWQIKDRAAKHVLNLARLAVTKGLESPR